VFTRKWRPALAEDFAQFNVSIGFDAAAQIVNCNAPRAMYYANGQGR